MKRGVLFISYDGVLEPLGESQVLAYIEKLSCLRPIYLISFEKSEALKETGVKVAVAARIAAADIKWYILRYHKKPAVIATAWDITRGTALGLWIAVRYRLSILHARSYVPSVMALVIKRLTGVRYIFDMRGFWADERVDGGLWPRDGRLYNSAKWFEGRFLLGADHVISLTHSAVRVMGGYDYLQGRMPPFTVIPTCADLQLFKPTKGTPRSSSFVLGYVGTAGTWYLFKEVAATFVRLRAIKPDARLLIINRGEHEYIWRSLLVAGVPTSAVEIVSAALSEVPALMARMHASIFFIKPVFSKQASAPTKLAELLGCGIPCLSNYGVGDMADVLEAERVGVVIKSFDEASLYQGIKQLLDLCADPEVSDRCVVAAHRHFSLDEGVVRYERIYSALEE